MTSQEVFDGCLREGVPCGKFLTIPEVLADPQVWHNGTNHEPLPNSTLPQVRHNGTVEEYEHPFLKPKPPAGATGAAEAVGVAGEEQRVQRVRWRTPRPPAQFARTPSAVRAAAPRMGQDSAEVLQELLGIGPQEVAALRESKVVGK